MGPFSSRRDSLPRSFHGGHNQLACPDVPIANRVSVILKLKSAGTLPATFLNGELRYDSVVQNGDRSGLNYFPVSAFFLPDANDVVGLPLARPATGINQGDTFVVERGCLPIGIGVVLK